MKISELSKKLAELEAKHGDVDVYYYDVDQDEYAPLPREQVVFNERKNRVLI